MILAFDPWRRAGSSHRRWIRALQPPASPTWTARGPCPTRLCSRTPPCRRARRPTRPSSRSALRASPTGLKLQACVNPGGRRGRWDRAARTRNERARVCRSVCRPRGLCPCRRTVCRSRRAGLKAVVPRGRRARRTARASPDEGRLAGRARGEARRPRETAPRDPGRPIVRARSSCVWARRDGTIRRDGKIRRRTVPCRVPCRDLDRCLFPSPWVLCRHPCGPCRHPCGPCLCPCGPWAGPWVPIPVLPCPCRAAAWRPWNWEAVPRRGTLDNPSRCVQPRRRPCRFCCPWTTGSPWRSGRRRRTCGTSSLASAGVSWGVGRRVAAGWSRSRPLRRR